MPVINPGPLTYKLAETVLALGLTQSRKAYPKPNVEKIEMIKAMAAGRRRERSGPRVTDNGGGAGGTRRYRIAALTGDGIGPEIMAEAEAALEAAAELGGFGVEVERHAAGAVRHLELGAPMDPELPDHLRSFDAILFGPWATRACRTR